MIDESLRWAGIDQATEVHLQLNNFAALIPQGKLLQFAKCAHALILQLEHLLYLKTSASFRSSPECNYPEHTQGMADSILFFCQRSL